MNYTTTSVKPVLAKNFPDPSLYQADDGFYAFGTGSNSTNVQIAYTPSFDDPAWELLDQDALPVPGSWTAHNPDVWAPYVHKAENENYVLYYTAAISSKPNTHCIGTAISKTLKGPYTPANTPMICPVSEGGAIDPTIFLDPQTQKLYLIYKVDGNCLSPGSPTPIKLLEISPHDGITPITSISSAITLIDRAQDGSDGPLVEAPSLFYNFDEKLYYLLYSTHMYNGVKYDLKGASASSINGPWTKFPLALAESPDWGLVSPGSADIDANGGNVLFHATVGYDNFGAPIRWLYAGKIRGMEGRAVFDAFIEAKR